MSGSALVLAVAVACMLFALGMFGFVTVRSRVARRREAKRSEWELEQARLREREERRLRQSRRRLLAALDQRPRLLQVLGARIEDLEGESDGDAQGEQR